MVNAPFLTKLIQAKDRHYHEAFVKGLDILNRGLEEKEIWNVEINDTKFTMSNAIERALDTITERWRGMATGRQSWQPWQNDFSCYVSFNQAAGRIKRLTKNAPKVEIIEDYITAMQEVDAIWKLIQSLKPFIKKGRRPNLNKTEEQIAKELKNTGICAICGSRQKLSADRMVHHGYEMSEYNHAGERLGKCFGTAYLCYELSNEACIAYAPLLAAHHKALTSTLRSLKSGKITELVIQEPEWNPATNEHDKKEVTLYKTGETAAKFAQEMRYQIDATEGRLRSVALQIEHNDAKIKNWTPQPLKYGRK